MLSNENKIQKKTELSPKRTSSETFRQRNIRLRKKYFLFYFLLEVVVMFTLSIFEWTNYS